jgi:DnaJ-domain-containing protein 1
LLGARGAERDTRAEAEGRSQTERLLRLAAIGALVLVVTGTVALAFSGELGVTIPGALLAAWLAGAIWGDGSVKADAERHRQAEQELEAEKQREALRQSAAEAAREAARKRAESERESQRGRYEEQQREAHRQQEAERRRQAEQEREAERRRRAAEQEREAQSERQRAHGAAQRQADDWWIVLDVPSDASKEEIVRSYRQKIRQYHPDRVSGLAPEFIELAERHSKALNAAYAEALRARR